VLLIHVGSQEVVPGLIGGDPLVEVGQRDEGFDGKELLFDGSMDGLDVAVIVPGAVGEAFAPGLASPPRRFQTHPGFCPAEYSR